VPIRDQIVLRTVHHYESGSRASQQLAMALCLEEEADAAQLVKDDLWF